jgi:starch-binding outer membrane protein, SusD/RagB family
MKKIIFILSIVFFSGCQDEFLNKEPLDIISDAAVWNDENYTNAILTNLYARAPFDGLFRSWYIWEPWQYQISPGDENYLSDDARASYVWELSVTTFNNGTINRETAPLYYWNYGLIRSVNEFLESIEGSTMPKQKVAPKMAEARFIRAFVYFQLVKRYGGVPLITRPQKIDEGDALFVTRNKEQEIYDFIIAECDAAAKDLPETYPNADYGRATRNAAMALKSRAALYAGSIAKYGQVQLNGVVGIPAADANKYFQHAYDGSKAVIDAQKHALFNKYPNDKVKNYASLFIEEGHQEVIFAKIFIQKVLAHNFDFFNVPHGLRTAGWASATNVTLDLVDAYEMIDGSDGNNRF